jgi:hypothetical protein
MHSDSTNPVISPDGLYSWDGKKWSKAPKGTIQKLQWDGESWGKVPQEQGGTVFSPDGKEMWTGRIWIPSPPEEKGNHEGDTNPEAKTQSKSLFSSFGNYNNQKLTLTPTESAISLATMILSFVIVASIFSTQIIQPLLFDASIVRTGRYALTMDAWDTVEGDDAVSVVGIGSSMLQYAMNGTCIEQEMESANTFVYNLAIPGSMPYMEMIQTEAAVRASPELVLLEVGPNSLWDVDEFSNQGLMDYFELRLTILSLMLESDDEGQWMDILRDSELKLLDHGIEDNFRSESIYANDALEEVLRRAILDKSSAPRSVSAASVPHPSHEDWHEYLRTQNWLYSKLERMTPEERSEWEGVTIPNSLLKGVNNPESNGTLNHDALEYMVSRFSESGIKVILMSPPLHPLLISQLSPGQYDGHNHTLSTLSEYEGVEVLNLVWEEFWSDEDFYDHNHLDRHGRETFCVNIAPRISEILEG